MQKKNKIPVCKSRLCVGPRSCKEGPKCGDTLFHIIILLKSAHSSGSIDKYNLSHYTLMTTWWFGTYNEYIKNFEKIVQLQQDYIRNLEHMSHLYNELIKNVDRLNELYNKYIASFEKLSTLYEQQFQNMQRMNQKWLDLFSKPWGQYQSEKHTD